MFMNECIDSTIGRIHVWLLCCLLVTIRGLVGPFNWYARSFFFTGSYSASRVRSNLMRASLQAKLQRVVVVKP